MTRNSFIFANLVTCLLNHALYMLTHVPKCEKKMALMPRVEEDVIVINSDSSEYDAEFSPQLSPLCKIVKIESSIEPEVNAVANHE